MNRRVRETNSIIIRVRATESRACTHFPVIFNRRDKCGWEWFDSCRDVFRVLLPEARHPHFRTRRRDGYTRYSSFIFFSSSPRGSGTFKCRPVACRRYSIFPPPPPPGFRVSRKLMWNVFYAYTPGRLRTIFRDRKLRFSTLYFRRHARVTFCYFLCGCSSLTAWQADVGSWKSHSEIYNDFSGM